MAFQGVVESEDYGFLYGNVTVETMGRKILADMDLDISAENLILMTSNSVSYKNRRLPF